MFNIFILTGNGAPQKIGGNKRSQITDMNMVVNGRPTTIYGGMIGIYRGEVVNSLGKCIM